MTLLSSIDHVAITVADIDASTRFFDDVFGAVVLFDHAPQGRALIRGVRVGGSVQINLHQQGNGFDLVAARPTPGSADLCFRFNGAPADAVALLAARGVEIVEGPVARVANDGQAAQSVYFRDPDGNLIELMAG